MSGCRIKSVKLKAGGTIVPLHVEQKDELRTGIIRAASLISGFSANGEMAGYVVIGWDKDGASSVGYRLDEDSFIRPRILPSFIADILREQMITTGTWGQE